MPSATILMVTRYYRRTVQCETIKRCIDLPAIVRNVCILRSADIRETAVGEGTGTIDVQQQWKESRPDQR